MIHLACSPLPKPFVLQWWLISGREFWRLTRLPHYAFKAARITSKPSHKSSRPSFDHVFSWEWSVSQLRSSLSEKCSVHIHIVDWSPLPVFPFFLWWVLPLCYLQHQSRKLCKTWFSFYEFHFISLFCLVMSFESTMKKHNSIL